MKFPRGFWIVMSAPGLERSTSYKTFIHFVFLFPEEVAGGIFQGSREIRMKVRSPFPLVLRLVEGNRNLWKEERKEGKRIGQWKMEDGSDIKHDGSVNRKMQSVNKHRVSTRPKTFHEPKPMVLYANELGLKYEFKCLF